MEKILIYTIALNSKGQNSHGEMAKILVSSLLRTYFTGDILIFHNGTMPIFRIEQKGVTELILDLPSDQGYYLKYQARQWIAIENYDWICFLDCDMIALRNIDHLFTSVHRADILWQPEPARMETGGYNSYFHPDEYQSLWRQGANSGTFAIRASHFYKVLERWEEIDQGKPFAKKISFDQSAWNRLLFDTSLRLRPFEKEEILFPILFHHPWSQWRCAALLHANGVSDPKLKLEFLMAQYLGRFLGEPPGPLLSILHP